MIKKLAKSIREYKIYAILSPIGVMVESAMEILIPFYMADLIDLGINAGDISYVKSCGLKLICFALIAVLGGLLSGYAAAKGSSGFASNLRKDMYYKIQNFSFANIDKFSTSGLVTRLTSDVNSVQMSFMMIIRGAVKSPFTFTFALIMAFRTNGKLPWIFVCVVPVLIIAMMVLLKFAMPLFQRIFKLVDRLSNIVQENVRGIRVVKAFVREDKEIEKFEDCTSDLRNTGLKVDYMMAFLSPVMQLCIYTSTLLISFFGAKLIVTNQMTTGQLTSMMSYVMQILVSLMMLAGCFMMISMSVAAAKRIVEVLDENPDIKNCDNPCTEIKDGSIEFKNVSFAYKDCANCLENINLKIESGQTIGILGGTGSGKTSLVQLIPRLYDASCGSVLVGGKDVKELDLQSLRTAVSMVLQKNVLFSGTIAENLRWGDANATDEDLRLAAKLSQAESFIEELPGKYNYMVEQGGTNLSGGQRQRLCIARALISKPKVLILDDSTSAVDTATDAAIKKSFREYLPQTTKLIIAQRISSVMDADKIVVLEDGRINGFGTHQELMATNKIYKEIHDTQMKEGDFDA